MKVLPLRVQHRFKDFFYDNQNDDDDDSVSTTSSSLFSELSYGEQEEEGDEHTQQPPSKKAASLKEKWGSLEQEFAERELLLNRITKTKSKAAFLRQIAHRERLVRRQAFEDLLSNYDDEETKEFRELLNEKMLKESATLSKPSFFQRCRDAAVFEWNSGIPATFSLIVHCLAHSGIYNGMDTCFDVIKDFYKGRLNDAYFSVLLFVTGVIMLRLSGDIYWWSRRDQDYDCVKFDYHNRLWLRYWDARILSAIRLRPILRVIVFLLGTHFACYTMPLELHSYFLRLFFDQREEVLKNLPSARFEELKGTCIAELEESYCSSTCEEEMERQESDYLRLKQADLNYTWQVLSSESYETYWSEWIGNSNAKSALFSNTVYVTFFGVSAVAAMLILRLYGIRMWDKY